jgi:hypothetical protein
VILGFSDATIAVVKRGPEEVREQGLLADHIGMNVCPRVLKFLDDGYEMEILSPPQYRSMFELTGVYTKLVAHVWNRRSYKGWNSDWLMSLHDWCIKTESYWLIDEIRRQYPEEPTDGYCLIHGDPTLANLMVRGGGERVITDPMPRMEYRREIPNRMEVDLGKLVQSAIGWERMLGCDSSMWEEHEKFLPGLPPAIRDKAVLWGAIHLARVAVRAPKKGKHKIASWAKYMSQELVEDIARGLYR